MNRSSRLIWTAALVLSVGCVAVWFYLDHAVGQKRDEARDLVLKRAAIERQLAGIVGVPPISEKTPVPARVTLPPGTATAPAQPTEGDALLHDDALRRTLLRTWAARTYEPFYRSAGLTPPQIEAFEQAVIAHWMRWADTMEASLAAGVQRLDSQTWATLRKSEAAQFRQEENEALGPELLSQLDQFERRMPMKPVADAVAGAVFDSGEPLTPERAAALVDALANNSSSYRSGGKASLDNLDLATALTQLQVVLTPRQLDAVRSSLATRLAVRDLMRRLQNRAAGNGH